jgi:hypothetical protein
MVLLLLNARIKHEEKEYEEARTTYGPRQVYVSEMNQEQWHGMLLEVINRLKPEQIDELDDLIIRGKSLATRDIEHGQKVRAKREAKVDTKSENNGN